ncbi:MAG: type III-A CRISPR-associated RAMP protein Csm3 [Bacteroidales bacterium]|jgi:CRISPR-associated protein Csm3|nr:type III-A CRISPR-associated RAMP protein Csm3 [Bacteroidales bacterium]
MEKLIKKIKINTTLTLLTGLHIGGSGDSVEIGGIDNPVIKIATKDNQPYIPGSSLKGKMRCLLEQMAGSAQVGGNKEINNMFGYQKTNQPSKIIVRDSFLTEKSAETLRSNDNLDMPYTEAKWENVIDRVKGTAEHPRQTERIPAGVTFDVEFIINVWDDDNADNLVKMLKKGINALENDYLGGSGSRGYGQIKFSTLNTVELSDSNNWKA